VIDLATPSGQATTDHQRDPVCPVWMASFPIALTGLEQPTDQMSMTDEQH